MKKLLVLMLILATASVANAGFILSVNGQPADEYITLMTSETITLDIQLSSVPLFAGGDIAVVISNPQGALDYSGIEFITSITTRAYFPVPVPGWYEYPAAWETPWSVSPLSNAQYLKITGGNFANNTVGDYTLADQIIFHCEEDTDVMIDLVAVSDLMYWQYDETGTKLPDYGIIHASGSIIDTIHVTQIIPEPMTIVLLGLGGLFLRRRK